MPKLFGGILHPRSSTRRGAIARIMREGFGGVAPGTSYAVPDSGGTVDGLTSSCAVRWRVINVDRKPRVTTYILVGREFRRRTTYISRHVCRRCCRFFPRTQVPTALLLERPLVMSSTLLDAYPCLRKSRVHSLVGGRNLS